MYGLNGVLGIVAQKRAAGEMPPGVESIQAPRDSYTDSPSGYTDPKKAKGHPAGWPKCLRTLVGGGRLELPTNGLKVQATPPFSF